MEPNMSAPTSPRTGLYIGIAVVALLAVGGWFFMRGASPLSGVLPGGVDMDRNLDGSTTYSNDEGSVTVGGNRLPDNWPSDAPAYAGAAIQYSGSTNPQTGTPGSAVVFNTQDGIEAISNFYKRELASKGWTISQTAAMGGATVIAATKDTRTFGVYIVDAGDSRTVTVGIELPQ